MPDTFKLNDNDALVRRYLTQAERNRIQNAHTTDAWDFEFHGGHETGTPLYIRPDDCDLNHNLPKFDTHTLSGTQLTYKRTNLQNKDNLEQYMNKTRDRELMFTVVSTNWDLLCTVAKRYVDGDAQGAAEQARLTQPVPVVATTKPCVFQNWNPPPAVCPGQVPIYRTGKGMCPVCGQYS